MLGAGAAQGGAKILGNNRSENPGSRLIDQRANETLETGETPQTSESRTLRFWAWTEMGYL
jgi:hypothetical protein